MPSNSGIGWNKIILMKSGMTYPFCHKLKHTHTLTYPNQQIPNTSQHSSTSFKTIGYYLWRRLFFHSSYWYYFFRLFHFSEIVLKSHLKWAILFLKCATTFMTKITVHIPHLIIDISNGICIFNEVTNNTIFCSFFLCVCVYFEHNRLNALYYV